MGVIIGFLDGLVLRKLVGIERDFVSFDEQRWEAVGDTAAAYDYWRSGSGRQQVPGIIKCFGARPDFLRQVVDFSNTVHFSEGHLLRHTKEMIASYVSYLNRCPY